VADCPLHLTSPNAPRRRDVLGTVLLSVLSGQWRYAHITGLRGDGVNPMLLGMRKVVSEDAVRRALGKIDAGAGIAWLGRHLDYCTGPLLSEPWVLDVDTTVRPLFGHQEGAVVGYNPRHRGRPSQVCHTYMMAALRLVLEVEVAAGNRHTSKHAAPGLWELVERLGPSRRPALLRGDGDWGKEAVMSRAEQEGLAYLFKLQLTRRVKQLVERMMDDGGWTEAGQGWEGREGSLRLEGWSRSRRVVVLRRRCRGALAVRGRDAAGQLALGFAEVGAADRAYETAVLVTSLDHEILSLAQLYRERGDIENAFDELKNQWGWGGFTTRDLARCRLMARTIALVYDWWTLLCGWPTPSATTRRSPAGRCCCTASPARPATPGAPPSPSARCMRWPTRRARPIPASPPSSPSCGQLRSSCPQRTDGASSSAAPSSSTSKVARSRRRLSCSTQTQPPEVEPTRKQAQQQNFNCRI